MPKASKRLETTRGHRKPSYEPAIVVAAFGRSELADELPEVITPHIHSVQSS